WVVGITSQQRVERRLSLIETARGHVVTGLSGYQNFLSLIGRDFVRQERHSHQRQPERFDDFPALLTVAYEFVQDVVSTLEIFKADVKQCSVITDYAREFGVVVYA